MLIFNTHCPESARQRGRVQASSLHLIWPRWLLPVAVKVSAKSSEICKNWVAVETIVSTTVLTQCGAGHSWRLVPCGQGLLEPRI